MIDFDEFEKRRYPIDVGLLLTMCFGELRCVGPTVPLPLFEGIEIPKGVRMIERGLIEPRFQNSRVLMRSVVRTGGRQILRF